MIGGQNSPYTLSGFVTSTTPAGNTVPPLDLARVLLASRASFVARKLATDRDHGLARPGRLELPTLCLEGRRSIRLSYGRLLHSNPTPAPVHSQKVPPSS